MKRRDLFAGAGVATAAAWLRPLQAAAKASATPPPFSEVMHHSDKARSGVILGGMGAGGGELRKDGRFCNWTIFNNAPRGTGPRPTFTNDHDGDDVALFTIRYQEPGQEPRIKVLQIEEGHEVATIATHIYEFPWLTGVDKCEYRARFPIAELVFTDPQMPVAVRMQAMGFFIPHDVKNSTLPAILFSFTVTNLRHHPVDVMLMASQRNGVGYDVAEKLWTATVKQESTYKVIEASARNVPAGHSSAGTMALASWSAPGSGPASMSGLASGSASGHAQDDSSHYLGWEHRHPYWERVLRARVLPNIDETEKRTARDPKTGKRWALPRVYNTLARSVNLPAKASFGHNFATTWFFPNMYNEAGTHLEGNYYANHFSGAAEVAAYVVAHEGELVAGTRGFIDNLYETSIDQYVLDQINSQLNTFVSNSFLSKAGQFGILEGLLPEHNMGPLATTDVSVYGAWPIAAFFPELQKATMRAHRDLQRPSGEVGHSLQRDFSKLLTGVAGVDRRLDLHPQYVSMVLRDFFWTDDRAYLTEMWPSVKRALDYVIKERDLNGDGMPDMEGIMSSYDNFPMFGTASYIGSQWIAALAGTVQAARTLNDTAAAERYGALLTACRRLFDERLWNGHYYRLWNDEGGKHGGKDEGCLTDQLVGQWVARPVGLGDIVPRPHLQSALKEILKRSYRPGFGLRNCSWPGGDPWQDIPDNIWVDQANTCWSGVELAFASFLIYEGLWDEGLKVIKTVDDRYRRAGRYWDHQEFGGHYYRPMAAWMILNGMLGLSINQGVFSFAPKPPARLAHNPLRVFFAAPTGTAIYTRSADGHQVSIDVKTGHLALRGLDLTGPSGPAPKRLFRGDHLVAQATSAHETSFRFAEPLLVTAPERLHIR